MKKKIVQLPQGYISYSQLALWQNDPKRYAEIYFDRRDELRTTNAGMEYGKVVADALEHGVQTDDLLTDAAMLLLPKYDIADQEIRAELKTAIGWVPLLGKPDSLDSKTKAFLEYKTGKTEWNRWKAQDHLQMHFYAMVIFLKHKVLPPSASLVWIQTEMGAEGVKPTGRVEEFPVAITMKRVLDTMALVSKAAKEIEIAYASHIPNPALAW